MKITLRLYFAQIIILLFMSQNTYSNDKPRNEEMHYCMWVRSIVNKHVYFPKLKNKDKIEETVKVILTLNRKGRIVKGSLKIFLDNKSKYKKLNIAALKTIKKASKKFPPIPEKIEKDTLTFINPIKYVSNKKEYNKNS